MLTRELAEEVFAEAVRACDPAALVRAALADVRVEGRRLGLAVGKAALAMARGAGPVAKGLVIAPFDDGAPLPAGWRMMLSSHPVPDERSVAAGEAAIELASHDAQVGDLLLALISGGASSLMEVPRVPLDEVRAITSAAMAAGAPISTLNLVRAALSRVKAGGLVAGCAARVVTLAISDVNTDFIATIGSGPTIPYLVPVHDRPRTLWERSQSSLAGQAVVALAEYDLESPALEELASSPPPAQQPRIGDVARVIASQRAFADAALAALVRRGLPAACLDGARSSEIDQTARVLVGVGLLLRPDIPIGVPWTPTPRPLVLTARVWARGGVVPDARVIAPAPDVEEGLIVAWGEPTLVVPADHGEGGRAQQLALLLARELRGTDRAALVIGSDGMDGPAPAARPAPAGAFVDGGTWDAILAASLDPEAALVRRDAGTVLAAVGALVVTGPTGINHADLVIIG